MEYSAQNPLVTPSSPLLRKKILISPWSCLLFYFPSANPVNVWSLLFLIRITKNIYNFYSITGFNNKYARKLSQNVATDCNFSEVITLQQTNYFLCGIHLMVNMINLLNKLTKQDLNVYIEIKQHIKLFLHH